MDLPATEYQNKKRKMGLPRTKYPSKKRSLSVFIASDDYDENYFRPRSSTWSTSDTESDLTKGKAAKEITKNDDYTSDRHIFAVIANVAHIVIGVAITQLGIVGTWYQRYMNFPKDQLRHVIYICVLFIILGAYGMCVVLKKLGTVKSHRTAYIVISSFCIVAACFITANGIRMLASDSYQTRQTVVVVFDGLMIALAIAEVPVTLVGLYTTLPSNQTPSTEEKLPNESVASTNQTNWCSIFHIVLNVAHVVLGLCITELGMVGMMYRNFMNIDNSGLFAVVFVSLSFISVGIIGIYNQLTGKSSTTCNRSVYTLASLLSAGCATIIMCFVSIAMSRKQYYTGIEAIVAFDVMILSMSSIELVVTLVAIALCLIPVCVSKLKESA